MNSLPSKSFSSLLALFVLLLTGCGSGGSNMTPPPAITITSTPTTSAEEGVQYSYQLAATSSNSSPVTFSLTASPSGAALSGNAISWTPTHAESRTSNSFTVTATTASGGSATQSWTVTPNGIVNITAFITYWTPTGSINVKPLWIASNPFPAALVPQSDGSLQRLQGSANADGSFSIPNVPAGDYWLQINPNANYWTQTSDFDFGQDFIGSPLKATSQSTTTFNISVSGLQPSAQLGNLFTIQSDLRNLTFPFVAGFIGANATTFTSSIPLTSDVDWSQITTLYFSQYNLTTAGNFTGYLLGPTQTLSNVSITNGTANAITPALSPSPAAPPLSLSVTGTAWAALLSSVAPSAPTPAYSDYAAFVQPFVTDRFTAPTSSVGAGPDLALLRPVGGPRNPLGFFSCDFSTGPTGVANVGLQPIVTDVDYGTLSYGDPYPSNWLRLFEYCQASTVSLPRLNSTVTDTFFLINRQTTALPTGAVAPILSAVQSPTLNGNSLFQSATVSANNVTISWSAPAIGQPYGYFVSVYQFTTTPTGPTLYAPAGRYATAKTSLTVPFLAPANTYVFTIVAAADANATVEKNPNRHKIPNAESGVVSAPFVIQ